MKKTKKKTLKKKEERGAPSGIRTRECSLYMRELSIPTIDLDGKYIWACKGKNGFSGAFGRYWVYRGLT